MVLLYNYSLKSKLSNEIKIFPTEIPHTQDRHA